MILRSSWCFAFLSREGVLPPLAASFPLASLCASLLLRLFFVGTTDPLFRSSRSLVLLSSPLQEAIGTLQHSHLMAPVYLIVAGANPGEVSVIA